MTGGPTDNERALKFASFPRDGVALVIGATGGVGSALLETLESAGHFRAVIGAGRRAELLLDLSDETSIEKAASHAAERGDIRLVIDATGFLHDARFSPEKSWRDLDAQAMAHVIAVNAIGPALLMKHFLPVMPRTGRSVFATLSARVGSISDNRLGGWYSYRASKAALNQIVRTAAIELTRRAPEAVCVALHPGTVQTALSRPFARDREGVLTPLQSARALIAVIDGLGAGDSGGFFDWRGATVDW